MAFTNVRNVPLAAGVSLIVGTFTQTAGAASQSLAIGGGRVVILGLDPNVTVEPVDFRADVSSDSISGAINTFTIYGSAAVTAGTFVLLVDAGG